MKLKLLLYPLIALLLFLGIGGLAGGALLMMKPDGSGLGMNPEWLGNSPFRNYFIPGLILFLFNGALPLITVVGLILRREWTWANALNLYPDRHWAWAFSLYTGIIIIIWITVQLVMTQYFWLQPVMIFTGVLILIFTLTPAVMRSCGASRPE